MGSMNPHFFTAPFYFAFIWFRVQGSGFRVQGSGFKVQGSRGGFAAFFRRWYSRIAVFPSRERCPFQHFSLQPQLCCSRGGLCRRDDALLGHEGEDDGHALRAFLRV